MLFRRGSIVNSRYNKRYYRIICSFHVCFNLEDLLLSKVFWGKKRLCFLVQQVFSIIYLNLILASSVSNPDFGRIKGCSSSCRIQVHFFSFSPHPRNFKAAPCVSFDLIGKKFFCHYELKL